MTGALPLLLPSMVPGVEGVVSVDPPVLQCQTCGVMADRQSVGLSTAGLDLVAALSHIHFHCPPWPDGTNPRECRPCRLARGCACAECSWQRRGRA